MNSQTAHNDTPGGLPDWCAPDSAAVQKLSALILGRWSPGSGFSGSRTSRGYDYRRGVEETSRAKSRKSELSRRTADEPLKRRLETRHLRYQLDASSPLAGFSYPSALDKRVAHFIELSASDNRVEQFRSSMRRVSGGLIRQFLSGSRVTRTQAKQQLDGALVGALESFMVRLGGEAGLSTSIELDAARMDLLVDLVASRLGDLSEIDARRFSNDLVSDLRESLLPGACIGTARGFIRASRRSLVAILGKAPEPDQVISETSRWVPVDVRY